MPHVLRIVVLRLLAEQPRSGYALIKTIHERVGWRPSFGSLYPLLDDLTRDGLLSYRRDRRSKIYYLTSSGKRALSAFRREHAAMLNHLHRMENIMTTICKPFTSVPRTSVHIQTLTTNERHRVQEHTQNEEPLPPLLSTALSRLSQALERAAQSSRSHERTRVLLRILKETEHRINEQRNTEKQRATTRRSAKDGKSVRRARQRQRKATE